MYEHKKKRTCIYLYPSQILAIRKLQQVTSPDKRGNISDYIRYAIDQQLRRDKDGK